MFPDDFNCYKRAENMPDAAQTCPLSARATLLGNVTYPAGEAAAQGAAGMAAAAALLQADDKQLATVRSEKRVAMKNGLHGNYHARKCTQACL